MVLSCVKKEHALVRIQLSELVVRPETAGADHLERLCRWEYVVAHGGGRGKLIEYQLLYDGRGHEGDHRLVPRARVRLMDGILIDATLEGLAAEGAIQSLLPIRTG